MSFKMTHIEAKSVNIWLRYESFDKRGKSSFNYAKPECDCSHYPTDNRFR